MYVPHHFQNNNLADNIEFIKKYPLGILITAKDGLPIANHLPFVTFLINNDLVLDTHLSKTNDQWQDLGGQDCLVIFSEPNAMIDATLFTNSKEHVPTWNYVAIHCYGVCRIIQDRNESEQKLNEMVENFNPAFAKVWDKMSDGYKQIMQEGIVTIEIKVKEIQAKWKLSQNKKYAEINGLVNKYVNSKELNKMEIGILMDKHISKK